MRRSLRDKLINTSELHKNPGGKNQLSLRSGVEVEAEDTGLIKV